MAFVKKTWLNRISEYANRRVLTDVNSGTQQTVTVTRAEGVISQEGDAFSAANMNDLEERIKQAFEDISPLIAYPIGSVYMSVNNVNPSTLFGGTWELIGTKLAVSENVYGNGYALGLSNSSLLGGLGTGAGRTTLEGFSGNFGKSVGSSSVGQGIGPNLVYGVPTKAQLEGNPQNSGLVVETATIYSWKRTA